MRNRNIILSMILRMYPFHSLDDCFGVFGMMKIVLSVFPMHFENYLLLIPKRIIMTYIQSHHKVAYARRTTPLHSFGHYFLLKASAPKNADTNTAIEAKYVGAISAISLAAVSIPNISATKIPIGYTKRPVNANHAILRISSRCASLSSSSLRLNSRYMACSSGVTTPSPLLSAG